MAVQAVKSGESVVDVARVLHVAPRSLFHWISRYRDGGTHALQGFPHPF